VSIPRLYEIDEVVKLTHRSKTWLYRNAGKTIPVTQYEPGGRLFWTEDQVRQIIALGAVEPGQKSSPPPAQSRRRAVPQRATPAAAGTVRRLEARPDARRKGRRSA
jgi:hypothetical protein